MAEKNENIAVASSPKAFADVERDQLGRILMRNVAAAADHGDKTIEVGFLDDGTAVLYPTTPENKEWAKRKMAEMTRAVCEKPVTEMTAQERQNANERASARLGYSMGGAFAGPAAPHQLPAAPSGVSVVVEGAKPADAVLLVVYSANGMTLRAGPLASKEVAIEWMQDGGLKNALMKHPIGKPVRAEVHSVATKAIVYQCTLNGGRA